MLAINVIIRDRWSTNRGHFRNRFA